LAHGFGIFVFGIRFLTSNLAPRSTAGRQHNESFLYLILVLENIEENHMMMSLSFFLVDMVKDEMAKKKSSMPKKMFPGPPQQCKPSESMDDKSKIVEEILKCTKMELIRDFVFGLLERVVGDDMMGPDKKVEPDKKMRYFARIDVLFKGMMDMESEKMGGDGGMGRMGGMGDRDDMKHKDMDDKGTDGAKMDMFGEDLFALDAKKYSYLGEMVDGNCRKMKGKGASSPCGKRDDKKKKMSMMTGK
jgi:hypothetical protein